jgi:5-formaminoimidazole-4-carboxamide-1-beta-D-ribofuranosyl 5'-monophosphate synthetase
MCPKQRLETYCFCSVSYYYYYYYYYYSSLSLSLFLIDASYHVSFHLAMRLQKRRFLEIDQSETRTQAILVSDWSI